MSFPVPVDARAAKPFEVILGGDELLRVDIDLFDATKAVTEGEWGGLTTDVIPKFTKATSGATSSAPLPGARVAWTKYVPGDTNLGQGDALATKKVTTLTGPYQAHTTLYDVSGTYTPGNILVVVYDSVNDRGVLFPVAPGSVTAQQLACRVGKVINLASGVLHYEAA
jgi:hypothetical protein